MSDPRRDGLVDCRHCGSRHHFAHPCPLGGVSPVLPPTGIPVGTADAQAARAEADAMRTAAPPRSLAGELEVREVTRAGWRRDGS
jgi:hypothetical protein